MFIILIVYNDKLKFVIINNSYIRVLPKILKFFEPPLISKILSSSSGHRQVPPLQNPFLRPPSGSSSSKIYLLSSSDSSSPSPFFLSPSGSSSLSPFSSRRRVAPESHVLLLSLSKSLVRILLLQLLLIIF